MLPTTATQRPQGSLQPGLRVRILRDDGHAAELAGKEGTVLPLAGHNPPYRYVVLEVADEFGEPAVWYVHQRHLIVIADEVH